VVPKALLLVWLAALAAVAPVRAEEVLEKLNHQLTDSVVIPGYRSFATAMTPLEGAVAAFCATPTPEHLAAARAAYAEAMLAWQRVQPIVLGPPDARVRAPIIQLFPDRRGVIPRFLAEALAAQDPALVAPGGLQGKSVALTGFPALEQILYDDARLPSPNGATAEASYACALAVAIARHLVTQANGALDDWQRPGGAREAVLTAGAGNDFYFDAAEATADLIKTLYLALHIAITVKLEGPLGASLEEAKPRRAESWRSGLSLADLRANLETAQALYASSGGFADALAALGGSADLDRAIRERFVAVFARLDAIEAPLAVAVEDPAGRAQVAALIAELKALRLLVAEQLAPALGLVIGFNAFDGDS
jgi:predicted lipoprotein